MYNDGELIYIGRAANEIRGLAWFGVDPDGSDFPQEFEFEADAEETVSL